MIELTLDYIAKNLSTHETWESILDFYAIKMTHDISRTGCDTYSVAQKNKFVKKISSEKYNDVMHRMMSIKSSMLAYMGTNDIDIRYNNDSLNEFYIIIKELGCEGPSPKIKAEKL